MSFPSKTARSARGRRRCRQRVRHLSLTGGSRLSVAGKKKAGRALGGWVFAGWRACGAAGLAQLASFVFLNKIFSPFPNNKTKTTFV